MVGYCYKLKNLLGVESLGIFPLAKFIIVMGMVSCVCVVMLSALGAGMSLVITHTLYHLVGINFLLLSLVFVPLLIKGLVLGWVGFG